MTALEPVDQGSELERYGYSWLAGIHSPRTRTEYARDLTQWVTFCHGHGQDPLTATRAHLDAWILHQQKAGAAPASIARRLVAVRGWYDHLVHDLDVLGKNPALRVKTPKVHKVTRVPVITLGHAAHMAQLARADGPAFELAFRLMFCNGLRLEEVTKLRANQVDTLPNGELYAQVTGKGGKIRPAVFSGRTADLIRECVWPPMRRHSDLAPDRPLIPAGRKSLWAHVKAWGEQAGVRAYPHALRHAAGTMLQGDIGEQAGVKLEWIQDFLGHADPRTTRRYDTGRQSLEHAPSRVLERAIEEETA